MVEDNETIVAADGESPVTAEPTSLQWRVFPLVEYPTRSVLAILIIFVGGVLVHHISGYWLLGLGAVVLLIASLYKHFLPTDYYLDEEGAEARILFSKRRRPWSNFHSYYHDQFGIMLSTFAYPSRLDSFRGLGLRFTKKEKDEVIAFVSSKLPRAEKRIKARKKDVDD
ncbi:MAG: hypothetical protein GY771_04555 [bacterium]|nr:hypothetical protein [bacterium]